jgi:hypothetical protein
LDSATSEERIATKNTERSLPQPDRAGRAMIDDALFVAPAIDGLSAVFCAFAALAVESATPN